MVQIIDAVWGRWKWWARLGRKRRRKCLYSGSLRGVV
jgi:hypothetical protein